MKSSPQVRTATQGLLVFVVALLAPAWAHAHVGVGQTSSLADGLLHPITGLDHVAVMLAVGLWAAMRGGRALWAVPASFVFVMALGGLLGMWGISIPFVESGIITSVLVLGVLVAAAVRLPLLASSLLVALFALFHGHAHGAEMPETAFGLAYGLGVLAGTGLLHGCGIGLGLCAQRLGQPGLIRYAGAATVALGIVLAIA